MSLYELLQKSYQKKLCLDRTIKEKKVNCVSIGTRVSAKTRDVNMFIAKMIVSSILMAEIAKTKVAKRGTEIHAEIGMKKVVGEKKVVQ